MKGYFEIKIHIKSVLSIDIKLEIIFFNFNIVRDQGGRPKIKSSSLEAAVKGYIGISLSLRPPSLKAVINNHCTSSLHRILSE